MLIIGESTRSDYMSLYGYPLLNTPFLSTAPGTYVHGLKAADGYTIGSLKLMLTKSDNRQADFGKTFIGLANSAGFETIWISNQGYTGVHDTPVTAIASQSSKTIFVHKGDYSAGNFFDKMMLPIFNKVIHSPSRKPRLIVLHTMGSHPDACKRALATNHRVLLKDPSLKSIECYVSSVRATDEFIEQVVGSLKSSDRRWSLLYFSDHGLSHVSKDGEVSLNNSRAGRYHFDVPLLRINSDDRGRTIFESEKDGTKMIYGIADWLGIKTPDLEFSYDLFDGISDKFDPYASKKVNLNVDDPAIDITGK